MRIRKNKILFDENGSALILVMAILISGILIFSSITSISLLQRSASSKVRSSTEALQLADSCMEWTLMKYYGDDVNRDGAINGVGAATDPELEGIGTIDNTDDSFMPFGLIDNLNGDGNLVVDGREYPVSVCKIYLIKDNGAGGDEIITDDDDAVNNNIGSITKIRSVGFTGAGEDKTMRAIQVTLVVPAAGP